MVSTQTGQMIQAFMVALQLRGWGSTWFNFWIKMSTVWYSKSSKKYNTKSKNTLSEESSNSATQFFSNIDITRFLARHTCLLTMFAYVLTYHILTFVKQLSLWWFAHMTPSWSLKCMPIQSHKSIFSFEGDWWLSCCYTSLPAFHWLN